jgi:hypothetical protein
VNDGSGWETIESWHGETEGVEYASADLSTYAGKSVDLRIQSSGDAVVEISEMALSEDPDEDGLPTSVEAELSDTTVFWTEEGTRRVILNNEPALDPTESDTDGDGLTDREEVWIQQPSLSNPILILLQPPNAEYRMNSHPNRVNTDDAGLNDAEEEEQGSNALVAERLSVLVSIPTYTQGPESANPLQVGESNTRQVYMGDVFTPDYDKGVDTVVDPPSWAQNVDWEGGDTLIVVPVDITVQQDGIDQNQVGSIELSLSHAPDGVSIVSNRIIDVNGGQSETQMVVIRDSAGTFCSDFVCPIGDDYDRIGSLRITAHLESDSIFDHGGQSVTLETPEYSYDYHSGWDGVNLQETGMNTFESGMRTSLSVLSFTSITANTAFYINRVSGRQVAGYLVNEVSMEVGGDVVNEPVGEITDPDGARFTYHGQEPQRIHWGPGETYWYTDWGLGFHRVN